MLEYAWKTKHIPSIFDCDPSIFDWKWLDIFQAFWHVQEMLRKCLGISHANAWKCLSISKHFVVWNAQYACNTKHFLSILALKGVSASCICLEYQAFSKHIGSEGGKCRQVAYAWKTKHFPGILGQTGASESALCLEDQAFSRHI